MSVAGNLVINLMGNTQHLNRALTRSASRIRAFSATSQRSLTSFGTTSAATFAAIGAGAARATTAMRNMSLAIGGGVAVGTGLAFRNLIKFDDAIRAAGARARTSAAGIEVLRERARELGRTSSFTQTQVAQMMEGLTKGGFTVEQVVGGMTKAVMDLSRAAGTEGEMAARLLGDSIGVFNLKASQSANVASVLAGVLNRTRMDVDDLADGFKFAAKTGADLGMSFSDTIAVMGTLAQAGLRGSLAGTAIRKIGQITVSEAAKIRKEFGITFKETKNGTVNVIENFEILSKGLQGLTRTDRLSKFFEAFGIRGAQAASSLADSAISTRALATELKGVFEAGTEAATTAAAMDDGIGGSMRRLLSAAELFGDMWASSFVEPVMEGIEAMREFTTEQSKFLKTEGIPHIQKGAGQATAAGFAFFEGLEKFGPAMAKGFFDYWKSKGKETFFFPVRTQAELRAEKGGPVDFLGGKLGEKQLRNRAALKALPGKAMDGMARFGVWLYNAVPRLPQPGGGLNNVPAGFKTYGESDRLRDGRLAALRGRMEAAKAQEARNEAIRTRPFVGPVDVESERIKRGNQSTSQRFIDFFWNRFNETIDNEQTRKAAESGNELADKFKGVSAESERERILEEAATIAYGEYWATRRSDPAFAMRDVVTSMQNQGASKQDINRMRKSQEKLRIATDKLARIREKTVRVEIAPEE